MGRPKGSVNKDKPFKAALLMEAALAEDGEASPAHKGSLRSIARNLLERASDDTQSAKEIADRFDGKVPTPVGGDPENPIEHHHKIEVELVNAENKGG